MLKIIPVHLLLCVLNTVKLNRTGEGDTGAEGTAILFQILRNHFPLPAYCPYSLY